MESQRVKIVSVGETYQFCPDTTASAMFYFQGVIQTFDEYVINRRSRKQIPIGTLITVTKILELGISNGRDQFFQALFASKSDFRLATIWIPNTDVLATSFRLVS